ncbi:PEPxxWA-CTERM sorting domain-containing protein [Glacieibacterium frigidum]|uniref:PEP-CTERM sorting domain-containing protein n=1 Tax=Glacieibacterium frigidum TaxID=2593303 RepID=A0A552UGH1_9SPHN|nr:PEPxxWA-CTERM sorting domain-containing protein [Glacieibacterium frigidum]TRW17316.1 PEP-CTERM sorting domain-containing protein [Glacieibacterium frigidum]
MLRQLVFILGLGLATSAQAALSPGSFGPASNPSVAQTPSFGLLAEGGVLGTNYIDFGVDFSFGNVEGYFDDGDALAFGGINGEGVLDLLTAVDGRIIVAGTTTGTTTGFISVEAGFASPGQLTLSVFDINNVLISSVVNDLTVGLNSRSLLTLTAPGIAYFSVSGTDTFGVAQINISGAAVPEPASWALMIGGFGLIGQSLRRRRAVAA